MNIQIIHCEQEFLVVNKPGGLLAVHRLDMATSGIMLLARTHQLRLHATHARDLVTPYAETSCMETAGMVTRCFSIPV